MTAQAPVAAGSPRPPARWRPPSWSLRALLVWAVLGLALQLEHWPLAGLISARRADLAGKLFLLVGAALVLACLVAAVRRPGSLIAAAGFVAAAAVLTVAASPLRDAGAYTKFLMFRGEYDMAVQAAKDGAVDDTGMVRIDYGPPLRVGFVWVRDATGWVGIVNDESGEVAGASAFGKPLFGERLVSCRPFSGHYYFCAFL